MAIYRGPGGSGDAVNDSSSETRLAVEARDAALAAQAAAEAAQAAAETAETNAELAETNAETAETNAAASASSASSSASSASTSATNASNSASAASTSATNAANSASSASTSATNAASSASSASSSASSASTSASNAATSATAAQAAQAAAEAAFDAFDDIYLGAKSSNPTVDNDGNALTTGDQYFNTVSNELRVWNGSSWQAASTVGGTVTSLTVTGATALNGGATLGDASGDALTINSSAVSIPNGLNFDSNTLVIDATNNNIGVGTSTPVNNGRTITIYNSSAAGTAWLYSQNGNSGNTLSDGMGLGLSGSDGYVWNYEAGAILLGTSGSERMRITSTGNVGIGTASPNSLLDVAGTISIGGKSTLNTTGANTVNIGGIANNGLQTLNFYTNTTGNIATLRATLDSSGNLGLGTTPSAWSTLGNGIQFKGYGYFMGRTDGTVQASIGLNNYFDGTNYLYSSSTYATQYQQYIGQHIWKTAASGTAGNAITFTQAMTLDASGNLGIGTTAPGGRMTVADTGTATMLLRSTNGSASRFGFDLTGVNYHWIEGINGGLRFATSDTERMRIDSSGNLLVGTSTNNTGLGTSPKQIIYGSITTDGSGAYPATTALIDDRAYNATSPSPGGAVIFGYKYNTGGSIALGPSIQGFKENSTDGNYASGLKFLTRANGASPAEAMRIGSAGQIGIGGANYGTAGQVLTSNGASSAPSWQTVSGGGSSGGGTTVSSAVDVTLTSSSTQIQYVSMTATDKYVILPDATTLQKGDTKFTIINSGNNLFGIKNSAGNLIVPVVAGSQTVTLNLQENATAAGKWSDQTSIKRLSAGLPQVSSSLISRGNNQSTQIAVLSATQALIFYMTSTTAINVVLATISGTTVTYGTPVSVVTGLAASNNYMNAMAYSSTQGILTYFNSSNTYIVAVSVSGSTVTVGTPTSATATGNGSYSGFKLSMIDTTTGVLAFSTSTTASSIAAFTVSGTTVTFGAPVSLSTTDKPVYGVCQISTGKVLVSYSEGTVARLRVYTNSGTTLTGGTAYSAVSSQQLEIITAGALSKAYTDVAGGAVYTYAGVVTVSGTSISSFDTSVNISNVSLYTLYQVNKYLSDGLQASVLLSSGGTNTPIQLSSYSSTQASGGTVSMMPGVLSLPTSVSTNTFDVISSTKFIVVSTNNGYVTTQIFEVLY